LIPLTFTKGIFLKEVPFERRVRAIFALPQQKFGFSREQLIIEQDEAYAGLRQLLLQRIDGVEDDSHYSPELVRALHLSYKFVQTLEGCLVDGTIMITNGMLQSPFLRRFSIGAAAHWFTRIVRMQAYAELYSCQRPDRPSLVPWDKRWLVSPLGTNTDVAEFYNLPVSDLEDISVGLKGASERYGFTDSIIVSVPRDSTVWRYLEEADWYPSPLKEAYDHELVEKYAIPQMVYRSLRDRNGEAVLRLDKYWVGRA
jgi:hypothetical protein